MAEHYMGDKMLRESDAELRSKLPTQESQQPDPFLQMTTGRMGAGKVTIFAVAMAVILSVVLYGLNGRASAPAQPNATVAAQSHAPAAAAPAAKPKAKG